MNRRTMLRRTAAALGGAVLGSRFLTSDLAHAARLPDDARIRIAMVLPGTTGTVVTSAALYEIVGDAARTGATLADVDVGRLADEAGHDYRMLMGHAPDAGTAYRTGERMVAVERATVLIGGLGEGQAEALARVADERDVLFINVGDGDDSLREGGTNVFHVAASNAMYLDALVDWHAAAGRRRWFIVHDPEALPGVADRARSAIEALGKGGRVVGEAEVDFGQPVYVEEMRALAESEADVVLLAVDVRDEILLRHRIADVPGVGAVAALPNAVSQTRDFIAASRAPAPEGRPDHRLMLWETTLNGGDAGTLNERFTSRTGQPMDPAGWATYQAVRAYHHAVVEAGSVAPDAVAERLRAPDFAVPSVKGEGVSFRAWDHQLRQPLYVVRVDPDADWGGTLSQRVGVAELEAVLPDEDGDAASAYDRYGDVPDRAVP